MKWTLTTKTQTYGVGAEVGKYEIRVTRTGNTVRVSFGNLNPGNVREGRLLIPGGVAKTLGNALLLASSGDTERVNVVFTVDEAKPDR
jgi:hypothetical protein